MKRYIIYTTWIKNDIDDKSELNLLHDIWHPSKFVKSKNNCYYPIPYGFINTRRGKAKFEKFQISLDIGFSPTIVTRILT